MLKESQSMIASGVQWSALIHLQVAILSGGVDQKCKGWSGPSHVSMRHACFPLDNNAPVPSRPIAAEKYRQNPYISRFIQSPWHVHPPPGQENEVKMPSDLTIVFQISAFCSDKGTTKCRRNAAEKAAFVDI